MVAPIEKHAGGRFRFADNTRPALSGKFDKV